MIALAIFLIFIFFVLLMYFQKLSALVALPLMAISIAIAAHFNLKDILTIVISEGSVRLHNAIITVFFGAILGQLLKETNIAQSIVRKTAELGGDNPFVVSIFLTIIIALLFTTIGGLGAVIMVATIVFPVMLSLGIESMQVACIFLFGLSLGGVFNFVNWQLYIDILKLKQGDVFSFAIPFSLIFIFVVFVYLIKELKLKQIKFWQPDSENSKKFESVRAVSFLTPLIPIFLVLPFEFSSLMAKISFLNIKWPEFHFPINAALFLGIVFGIISTHKKGQDTLKILNKSIIEGISSVAPAVALIMGIGMVLMAVMHPNVVNALGPVISKITPNSKISYILFFSILAPLSLYRGPLNLWGLGSGLVGLLLLSKNIPVLAIMALLMSVGQIQGVCDPTNTHNVWVANYLGLDVQNILKKTIPYMWVLAVLGLILGGIKYF